MGRIWLDVTSTMLWGRPAVGIIRVESECARFALTTLQGEVDFCRFDKHLGYLRVPTEDVRAALARLAGRKSTPAVSELRRKKSAGKAPVRKPRHSGRLESLARRLSRSLPGPMRGFLARRKPAARSAIQSLRDASAAVALTFRPLKQTQESTPPLRARTPIVDAPFRAGDVYVSLGLDWDQKDPARLAALKRQREFETILCCYDLIPIKLPHLCVGAVANKFARYFADMAWCATEFVSISEHSKRDLVQFLEEVGAPVPPVNVVRLGSDLAQATTAESADVGAVLESPFILFVSTIERRKNHETLYRAYARLIDEGANNLPRLVFVGMWGWGVGDLASDIRADPRVRELVTILSNVSDADLALLYRRSMFTVFPSLYEGWGLAVAESLAAGKFCLASNAASIPEVGGDLIEYLDPWDVPLWASRLQYYAENDGALKAAEARIVREYRRPTWESAARTVFERAREAATELQGNPRRVLP